MGFVIAIDGPAGAGKSTVAKSLARSLGWRYLDTGALYRAVTLAAIEASIAATDGEQLAALVTKLRIRQPAEGKTFLGERDVTQAIRDERVTALVSAVSAHPGVRRALLDLQREAGRADHLVCEGRDMGTVVFPNADVKIFLDADVPTRARRRRLELEARQEVVSQEEMERRIRERDRQDSDRVHAPLVRVPDQIHLDTSALPLEAVIARVREIVVEALHLESSRGARE